MLINVGVSIMAMASSDNSAGSIMLKALDQTSKKLGVTIDIIRKGLETDHVLQYIALS